ncbi:hypothetical protein ACIQTZ_07715 [Paenarthrobacter sp. NPDC090520]|uniref:hypothetical protein n=1 Tax=Paenarthrobacter sp. NPDC090520 TaxID=3364382 RepID=UPI0037F93357
MTNETSDSVHGRQPTQPVGAPPLQAQGFAPPSYPPPMPQYYQPQQPFPYQAYPAPVPPSYAVPGPGPGPGPGPVPAPAPYPSRARGAFGPSFWFTGSLLAIVALVGAVLGSGEAILVLLGVAAVITGLYALVFKRASWAGLPGRRAAAAVAIAGAVSLVLGGIAAGVETWKGSTPVAAPAAAGTIVEGVWLVGEDVAPGEYKTVNEVTDGCYWRITRPGGGSDGTMGAVTSGHPVVKLSKGQRFTTHGCGTWARQ